MDLRAGRFVNQLLGDRYYEPLERYEPERSDFIALATALLPSDWNVGHRGVWNYCNAPSQTMPTQGWKIHLSATMYNARSILSAAIPILRESGTSFKFAVDRTIFGLMNGKLWPRGGSGKFITVYPSSDDEFRRLLDLLHRATLGHNGPYILSDRRYTDAGIVYYRYGTMRPVEELAANGRRVTYLHGPGGERQVDRRLPKFDPPAWAHDPFPAAPRAARAPGLKDGRYVVKRVLSFTNAGGVYVAEDTRTKEEVVLKEARPFVGGRTADGDAVALLHKEYRILGVLDGCGSTPRPRELFRDWEHWYLVEDLIAGETARKLQARESILLQANPDAAARERYRGVFRTVAAGICRAVAAVHARGIVLCDLSHNNVMVGDDHTVTLIDFEAACQDGVDQVVGLWTPGFAARGRERAATRTAEDDLFSLAATMLGLVFPLSGAALTSNRPVAEFVRPALRDAGIPSSIGDAIELGLSSDPAVRPTARRFAEIIESADWNISAAGPCAAYDGEAADPRAFAAAMVEPLANFIAGTFDASRTDRLFPCDFEAYETNPLSLGSGAYGTLLSLHAAERALPAAAGAWLARRGVDNATIPPGFIAGQSGIAWALAHLGEPDCAASVLASCAEHPRLAGAYSLFDGLAGYALANLRVYLQTNDVPARDRAVRALRGIVDGARYDDAGNAYWIHHDDLVHLGLGYGAAGIALALLYGHLALDMRELRELGVAALRHEAAHAQPVAGGRDGLSWGYTRGDATVHLPYVMYGSAGIGAAMLRYRHYLGTGAFDDTLEGIYLDTDRKYSVGVGTAMGLSGLAGFRMDAYRLTGERRHAAAALHALEGIHLLRIAQDDGTTAYPVETHDRISCDYAWGCGGVLATAARIARNGHDEMLLDDLVTAPVAELAVSG